MVVRIADDGDRSRIVGEALAHDPSPVLAWAIAPAGDSIDARRTLVSWLVCVALDFGSVFIDDAGRVLGGVPEPMPYSRDHARAVLDGTAPTAPTRRDLGMWMYPAGLSAACNARLNRLARTGQLLLPPWPVQRLTVGFPPRTDELWSAWLDHAASRPSLVIAALGEDEPAFERLGFVPVAEIAAHRGGRPGLRSWLRTGRD